MAVGKIPTAMCFPMKGLTKERITSEEEAGIPRSVAVLGMPKFHKFDYRQGEKTRPFPKWVMFPQVALHNVKVDSQGKFQLAVNFPRFEKNLTNNLTNTFRVPSRLLRVDNLPIRGAWH